MARIRGTQRGDLIIGTRNNDTIEGLGGDDRLFGLFGDDIITGGDGRDLIVGLDGRDSLYGGTGDDTLFGNVGDWVIDGGSGNDVGMLDFRGATGLLSFSVAANLVGSVDVGGTQVRGLERIRFEGGRSRDLISGGALEDELFGNGGEDFLSGGGGNDRIDGGAENDQLDGGAGVDELDGGSGNDVLDGGLGVDRLSAGAGNDRVVGGFAGSETLADRLMDGGAGIDIGAINMSRRGQDIDFSVAANLGGTVNLGGTLIRNFERIEFTGGTGNDRITGGSLDDMISGFTGNDTIAGAGGNDRLLGQVGDDRLTGGAGNDRIDGGDGVDTAIYSGVRADYEVQRLADGTFRVIDRRAGSADGTDDVQGVERFQFADGTRTAENVDRTTGAADDAVGAGEDSATVVIPVLANDVGNLTLVSIGTGQTRGTATANADGTVSYSPGAAFQSLRAGQTATDSFTYTARDAGGRETSATVTVTIAGANDGPQARGDAIALDVGGEAGGLDALLLANDLDPDAGDTKTIVGVETAGLLGELVFDPDTQSMRYVANDPGFEDLEAGETATTSFTYTMRDASGATSTATVQVTVNGDANPPPGGDGANPDTLAFTGKSGAVDVTDLVLGNDVGPGLRIVGVDMQSASGANLIIAEDGRLVYDPDDLWTSLGGPELVIDSFSYIVEDAEGNRSAATVTMNIQGIGRDHATYVTVDENDVVNFYEQLVEDAADLLGSEVADIRIHSEGILGEVYYDAAERVLDYTATHSVLTPLEPGDVQQTSFTYTVVGTNGDSTTGIFVIDVEGQTQRFSEASTSAFGPAESIEAPFGIFAAEPVGLEAASLMPF